MFETRLTEVQGAVQGALDAAIARLPASDLRDAIAYAAQGGKRLRAFLVLESAAIFGISEAQAMPAPAGQTLTRAVA